MEPYYHDADAGITIYCGDCRNLLPVIVQSEKPRLLLADPPYGVRERTDRRARGRSNYTFAQDFPPVAGDDVPFNPEHLLELNAPTILWGANHYADKLPVSASWLVWDKRDGTTSDDNADCELAWSNIGGPARLFRHLWRGMITASERTRKLHPTQKPIALMRWCIARADLKPGDLVLDPYMGSGPIAAACKQLGMRYIGIELSEAYCATAVTHRLSQDVMIFSEAA